MIFTNTEFYYSSPTNISNGIILIEQDEAKHISQVMRNKINDTINVTDGIGNIYKSTIIEIDKNKVELQIVQKYSVKNGLENISFFVPILKSSERFEFVLEKCVELGITNFKIFSADKSYKRGVKLERWNKILLSSMKQSLQSFIPKIEYVELSDTKIKNDVNLIFDQEADYKFSDFLLSDEFLKISLQNKINCFFGPEAGLTEKDKNKINNPFTLRLTNNRLRAETAIMATASIISTKTVS